MCTCGHEHATATACNAAFVLQFQSVQITLPGRFKSMAPYLPAGFTLLQQADSFVLRGRYGFELCSGHRFVVTVDGQERTYTHWQDIPQHIGRVRSFQPGRDPHEVKFTIRYTSADADGERVFEQTVHNEPSGWVPRLQALLRREGTA